LAYCYKLLELAAEIRIKNKGELLHALTDKETFGKILEQGAEAHEVSEYIKDYLIISWGSRI
jgi:hypothetical protein